MTETINLDEQAKIFSSQKSFVDHGALILDLDGTALVEKDGRIYVPHSVEKALRAVHNLGRPIIINSLRFPLSVLKTIGSDWHDINCADIPVILLNGTVQGYIKKAKDNLTFEEIQSFPLHKSEIEEVTSGVGNLVHAGLEDIIVFYYAKNWQTGEIIWTPNKDRIEKLKKRYSSASEVTSSSVEELKKKMLETQVCMIFILIDAGEDKLMAYQHTKKNSYITHNKINKARGLESLAEKLNISLEHSIGAGDTELDNFLESVGLAIHVGRNPLPYKGIHQTVQVRHPRELGSFLEKIALNYQNTH